MRQRRRCSSRHPPHGLRRTPGSGGGGGGRGSGLEGARTGAGGLRASLSLPYSIFLVACTLTAGSLHLHIDRGDLPLCAVHPRLLECGVSGHCHPNVLNLFIKRDSLRSSPRAHRVNIARCGECVTAPGAPQLVNPARAPVPRAVCRTPATARNARRTAQRPALRRAGAGPHPPRWTRSSMTSKRRPQRRRCARGRCSRAAALPVARGRAALSQGRWERGCPRLGQRMRHRPCQTAGARLCSMMRTFSGCAPCFWSRG